MLNAILISVICSPWFSSPFGLFMSSHSSRAYEHKARVTVRIVHLRGVNAKYAIAYANLDYTHGGSTTSKHCLKSTLWITLHSPSPLLTFGVDAHHASWLSTWSSTARIFMLVEDMLLFPWLTNDSRLGEREMRGRGYPSFFRSTHVKVNSGNNNKKCWQGGKDPQ